MGALGDMIELLMLFLTDRTGVELDWMIGGVKFDLRGLVNHYYCRLIL